jgi:hypothetical protein
MERYPDDVILKCLVLNRERNDRYPHYDDRLIMIHEALNANFSSLGEWSINSNNKDSYVGASKLLVYTQPCCGQADKPLSDAVRQLSVRLYCTPDEINRGIDIINKTLRVQNVTFHYLSILELRHKLLEKCSKWKDSTLNRSAIAGVNVLTKLISKLDTIIGKPSIQTNAYLVQQPL